MSSTHTHSPALALRPLTCLPPSCPTPRRAHSPVVTLSIFPGVLAEDVSPHAALGDWYSLLLMALFNAADFAAKNLPLPPPPAAPAAARARGRLLLCAAGARAAFLPAFVAALRWRAPPAAVALLAAGLGLTNGCAVPRPRRCAAT